MKKQTENGMIMYPMLCFSIGGLSNYLDATLIHELNHVYELTLRNIEGNKYYSEIKDMLVYNQLILLLLYVIPKDNSILKRRKYIM